MRRGRGQPVLVGDWGEWVDRGAVGRGTGGWDERDRGSTIQYTTIQCSIYSTEWRSTLLHCTYILYLPSYIEIQNGVTE